MAQAPSRYELLDRIAVGGMAEVFRAKAFGAHGFEKTLAIKRILPELARDPEFEERFIAEAKLAVELNHANVVQVLDFGRFAGTLFIAMELVSGLDLAALLKHFRDSGEQIPLPAAFQISIDIIRGLSFAHQNDVVHRDISPSNILISKAGEVKIADFGIAVALQADSAKDEGRIMGKWRYMSPEQTQGSALSARSDLFSAAVVIFEVFSGMKLFPGDESNEIIENIHHMSIPALADMRPGVPPALDEVLKQALERSESGRTITGGDMLRALTEASYKSSIVATSIDVADAVAEAAAAGVAGPSVKPSPAGEVDDLIVAHLAKGNHSGTPERRTAITPDIALAITEVQGDGGTMVKSGIDERGVTLWELDRETVAAAPLAKRRQSGEADEPSAIGVASSGDLGRYDTGDADYSGLKKGVLLSVLGFSTLIAAGIYFVGRGPTDTSARSAVMTDAASVLTSTEQTFLTIDSRPPGGIVLIDGILINGLTPVKYPVVPDTPLSITIRLDGYEDHVATQTLQKGTSVRIVPTLTPHVASLSVTSTPKGAAVMLDDVQVGVTPFVSATLRPGKTRQLKLTLKDHKTVTVDIDLARGEMTEVDKTLKSTLVFGTINIGVRDSWAHIYEGNKKIGDTSRKLRLRAGVHTLKLVNTASGKQKTVKVDVQANREVSRIFDL